MSAPVTSVIASNSNFGSEGTATMAIENAAPKAGEIYAHKLHDNIIILNYDMCLVRNFNSFFVI